MRPQTVRLVWVYVVVIALAAVFGAAQASAPRTVTGVLGGAASGAAIGLLLTIFENAVRENWARQLRRFKPWKIAAVRFLVYLAAFQYVPDGVFWIVRTIWPQTEAGAFLGEHHLFRYFLFALAVNLFMAVRRMLGARYLWAMTIGRYHRPREEERIVVFMDLKGSTPLAERLGTARYHDFLNDVFFDVAGPILDTGGSVYQYVGDEVVVTWTAERGIRNADCVRFLFAVEDALKERSQAYMDEYGSAPALRGALHIGPLMVGEIGDLNRQIVMIGDTMNTAARIEGACRQFGRDYVASASVLVRLAGLPAGISSESLGPVPLAGKVGEMELFALNRASIAVAA